jgi:predicted ATPase/DNA-binding SARP family transcriptional activator
MEVTNMPHLALYLLGSPRIECDGTPIEIDTRKAVALIAYLVVTGQRHGRDTLATLLWPEYDQPHARGALRRTLSTLNKALAGDCLDIGRETIGVAADANLWVDVNDFNHYLAECRTHGHQAGEVCTACLVPLSRAVTFYHDDFLAGFSLRDSPSFDDWQFLQADILRRELASALERLVHCHSALEEFDIAITYARRWLSVDRLHEPAHRQLMLLYAWHGQRTAALHQYRECVQVLDQELSVAPLEATTRLYREIKENRVPPTPAKLPKPALAKEDRKPYSETAATPSRNSPPFSTLATTKIAVANAEYPLVGRAAEQSTLFEAYSSINGSGRIIILEGEAGIGKTRLAEEFLNRVQERGAVVLTTRCYEGETHLAYGPIIALLRSAIAQKGDLHQLDELPIAWRSEVSRLLPELVLQQLDVPAPPPLDGPGAQSRFFEGLSQVLLSLCCHPDSPPGLILFDDVHWADSASLELLSYMVRRLREQPICLVFTWRGKQAMRDARLHQVLNEAQRSGKVTIVTLTRLDQASVRELVRSVLINDTKLPADLVDRLYSETEGLPFFLLEYLNAMAKGQLATGSGSAGWSLPGGVRDLLQSRLSGVTEIGWQLLNTAAVIGRSFDYDTLREASGRSEEETVSALEALIDQGLVEEVQQSTSDYALTYDFSHEKLRALVYEETSLARRRLLHRRIADVLASHARGPRKVDALSGQIAHHYQLAGNESQAAEYFRLAGEYARSLYANAEALAHFRVALALGHPDTAALHEAIGDLSTLLGEYASALKSYETAAALCNAQDLARVEHKLGTVYERRGAWEQAESHYEAALRVLAETGSVNGRAKLYADWSLTAYRQGQISKALELARQALHLAETAHDTFALAQVHNILGILASKQGDLEEAHRHLEESLRLAEDLREPGIHAAALNNLAQACFSEGEIDRAIALTEKALALSLSQGDRHHEAALHSKMADLLHAQGRSEAAMAHLKQAVSIFAEIGVEAETVQPEIWKLSEW